MQKAIRRGLFVGGFGLLLFAGWVWLGEQRGAAVYFSSTDLDLGQLPAGAQTRVPLTLENRGAGPVRVVGLESC